MTKYHQSDTDSDSAWVLLKNSRICCEITVMVFMFEINVVCYQFTDVTFELYLNLYFILKCSYNNEEDIYLQKPMT